MKEKEKKRLDDWYVFLLAIATLKQMYERNLFQKALVQQLLKFFKSLNILLNGVTKNFLTTLLYQIRIRDCLEEY